MMGRRPHGLTPPLTVRRPRGVFYLLALVLLAGAYVLTATAGLSLPVAYGNATPVWLPTGISLAALLLFGKRMWPGVALGAFVANALTDIPVWAAGSIAVGNTLEAVVGAYLVGRARDFDVSLGKVSDVLRLLLFGAILSTIVSATIGTATLFYAGQIDVAGMPVAWGLWWFGDVMGNALIAPLILILGSGRWRQIFPTPGRLAELGLLLLLLAGAGAVVFLSGELSHPEILAPFFVWGALRFRQVGAVIVTGVVVYLALWGTLTGLFRLPGIGLTEGVVFTEIGVAVLGATALILAATLSERERAQVIVKQETRATQLLERIAAASNEAGSMKEALETAIEAVCDYTGWPVGHAYLASDDDPELMVPTRFWCVWDPDRFARFVGITEKMPFIRGVGLPGRVLASGEAAWITDVEEDENFPRGKAAQDIGVRGAFGFPILIGREVVGVLEFFSGRIEEPDPEVLGLMSHVGSQLGRVIERERSGEAVKLSEERSRLIVATANDAFVAIDADSRIIDWNKEAERVFGWVRGEALGRPMPETIMPERYREAHYKGIKHFLDTGEGPVLFNRIELTALRREGPEFPVELTIWPIETARGYQFNAFVRDVTERRRLEEFREHFIAHAAHELRTPVATITGLLEIMSTGKVSEDDRKMALDTIWRQGTRLSTLINNLLDVTRLEQGQLPVDLQPVLLIASVQSAIESAETPEGVSVSQKVQPNLMVTSDPARLEQILTNLLTNAYRYGGATIRIEAQASNGWVDLSVEDDGVGVPEKLVPQLFEAFARGPKASEVGGSGLGLAIVRMLAEACGAQISYEPSAAGGARFVLRLPRG